MVNVTSKAIAALNRVKDETLENADAAIRLSVKGGGCSGLTYVLDWDTKPWNSDDKTFIVGGLMFYVDSKSALFLNGVTLDYSGGLNGKGFEFHNPKATQTCGCGMSFK